MTKQREHIASTDCWCRPVRDALEPDVVIHRENPENRSQFARVDQISPPDPQADGVSPNESNGLG